MVKDYFLGGLTPFLGGFWHSRQFEIVVVYLSRCPIQRIADPTLLATRRPLSATKITVYLGIRPPALSARAAMQLRIRPTGGGTKDWRVLLAC